MSEESERKAVKVGVRIGGGLLPGYLWNVDIIDRCFDEAMSFLNADQYTHLAGQVRELATQEDPTHSLTVDVQPIEGYFEIRDKGGILGKINIRVFFAVHKPSRTIVVLGAIKKENNGPTQTGDKITMRRRRRLHFEKLDPSS